MSTKCKSGAVDQRSLRVVLWERIDDIVAASGKDKRNFDKLEMHSEFDAKENEFWLLNF